MPPELDWYIWRPIMHERQLAKLHELEEVYSLDDLHDMHLACDVSDDLSAEVHAEAQRRKEEAEERR